LIKQPDRPAGDRHSLRNEAAFYRFCHDDPGVGALATTLPRLAYVDWDEALLAIEYIRDAIPLWPSPGRLETLEDYAARAQAVGFALATAHRTFRQSRWLADSRLGWLPREPPWVLGIHQPWVDMLGALTPAAARLIRIVQDREAMTARLDQLRRDWTPETLIHGDIKADNIIVRPPRSGSSPAPVEVRIVDWELVQIGDPAWDLAGALQDALVHWTASMPLEADLTPDQMAAGAKVPLASFRESTRALWLGYRIAAQLGPAAEAGLLARAVILSAARLIQSAYERSFDPERLTVQSVVLLQIGENLLADPDLGQIQLYGIPSMLLSS
jgi:hypothetical protein